MRERRRGARILPNHEVIGRIKATVPARIVDISLLGAQVEVPSALRPTVECDVSFPSEDGDGFRLRARVQRCRVVGFGEGAMSIPSVLYRAGLEFAPMNASKKKMLLALLDRIRDDGVLPGSEAILEIPDEKPFAS